VDRAERNGAAPGVLLAAIVLAAYGWSVGPLVGPDAAWRVAAAAAAGWLLSLAMLVPMSQRPPGEIARHGAFLMTAGAVPLIPLTALNVGGPSPAANVAVLSADGLLMLGLMIARLRQPWSALVWFAVLQGAGLATWLLLRPSGA
jgi:hypothetical protein